MQRERTSLYTTDKGDKIMGVYDQKVRVHKQVAQDLMFQRISEPIKGGLFFPSRDCLDLQKGLALGKIDTNSRLILFERDPEIMKSIKAFCRRNKLKNSIFFEMPFEDITQKVRKNVVTDINGDDASIGRMPTETIKHYANEMDMMFFDFCGEMKRKIYDAIRDGDLGEQSLFVNNPVVGFTFTPAIRHNDFHKETQFETRKIKYPLSGQWLRDSACIEKAEWTVSKALETLKIRGHKISDVHEFSMYKEDGKSMVMVFFLVDLGLLVQKNAKQKEYIQNGPVDGVSNAMKELQMYYDMQTSAGKKAGIKRFMNKIAKREKDSENLSAGKKAWETRKNNALVKEMVA